MCLVYHFHFLTINFSSLLYYFEAQLDKAYTYFYSLYSEYMSQYADGVYTCFFLLTLRITGVTGDDSLDGDSVDSDSGFLNDVDSVNVVIVC